MEQMLEFWRNSEKRKQSIIISLNNVKTTNGILSLIYSHTFNVRSRRLRAVGCFTSSPGNILCFIILIRNSALFYLCQIKPNSKLWHRFKAQNCFSFKEKNATPCNGQCFFIFFPSFVPDVPSDVLHLLLHSIIVRFRYFHRQFLWLLSKYHTDI